MELTLWDWPKLPQVPKSTGWMDEASLCRYLNPEAHTG